MKRSYEKAFPGSDPRNMGDVKHFAEVIARSTLGVLENALKVQIIRNKMRAFMSQFERVTNLTIPKEVHDSMVLVSAQYLCFSTL